MNLKPVIDDILCLTEETSQLWSDLHISPSTMIGSLSRHNVNYGTPIFQNTVDAKSILGKMTQTARKYL
jgi:hypothetical protein